ncbi:MAG: site-2 protease family protein [Alphaproteobacteria bacterium]
MSGLGDIVYAVSIWAVPVIVAITFHEAAHGYVAWRLGDDTAYRLGRVSFNPLKHIDLFGTIILPALLLLTVKFAFGWAKPVPVNFARLNRPRQDMVWVAAAGPATNIALAFASAVLIRIVGLFPAAVADWATATLSASVLINLILAVFNMLPLPPLDGGRVAVGLLPDALARPLARLERWGLLIIIGMLFILPFIGAQLGVNLSVFRWLVGGPVFFLVRLIETITGASLEF